MTINALATVIKPISCLLITAALGLELWMWMTGTPLRQSSTLWLWLISWARIALITHGLEAIAAIAIAPARHKPPLRSGLAVFFTGTVGLLELWRSSGTLPATPLAEADIPSGD